MTTITKTRRGRRWARRALPVMVATTAMLGMAAAPAHAEGPTIVVVSSNQCGDGSFKPHGEVFDVGDWCSDGHSAVLRVDVEPIKSNNGYDYLLWNPNGSGTVKKWNKSYAEGTTVCIQAGIGEYGDKTSWGFGSWDCTTA